MRRLGFDWALKCAGCGMLSSTLKPDIAGTKAFDEDARLTGLAALRIANFETMLDAIADVLPRAGKALEVGPGQGFFLDALSKRGWRAVAVEPDAQMADALRQKGRDVVEDVFPTSKLGDQRFDLIAFNDVLEHIPDAPAVLAAAHTLLEPGGLLLVNLPNANGVIYRVAAMLARMQIAGPYKRMWQYGLTSPHVHYFTPRHLRRAAGNGGFREVRAGRLDVLSKAGLKERIGYVEGGSEVSRAVTYALASAYLPIGRLLPSDITFHLFRRA